MLQNEILVNQQTHTRNKQTNKQDNTTDQFYVNLFFNKCIVKWVKTYNLSSSGNNKNTYICTSYQSCQIASIEDGKSSKEWDGINFIS